MDKQTFFDKWNPRQSELVSDLSEAVDCAGNPESGKVELLRLLIVAYQGILEGYETPGMASPVDIEMAYDITALINQLEGTSYAVNLPDDIE
jgi:hypothetical protein